MMMIIIMIIIVIIIIIIIIIIQNILTGLNTHQCFKTLLSMGWYDRKLWLSDKMLKDYNYTLVKQWTFHRLLTKKCFKCFFK